MFIVLGSQTFVARLLSRIEHHDPPSPDIQFNAEHSPPGNPSVVRGENGAWVPTWIWSAIMSFAISTRWNAHRASPTVTRSE
jgi:hypothetical protein